MNGLREKNRRLNTQIDTGDPSKSVFDLTPSQMDARFVMALEKLKNCLFEMGLPLTYQDDRCPTNDHFIREYQDGTIQLTIFDGMTRKFIEVHPL